MTLLRALKPSLWGIAGALLASTVGNGLGQALPFVISTQPSDQVVAEGGSTTFSVSGSGTQPLSFQWRRDGVDLLGATNSALFIQGVWLTNAGDYTVLVSNAAGVVTSQAALLSVGLGRVFTNAAGSQLPYRLFPPRHYDPAENYPLVLFWHGSGQSGTDNLSQLTDHGQFVFLSLTNQTLHPCFLLAPQLPFPVGCDDDFAFEDQTVELLQALAMEFGIDLDRLHVTGLSMGGFISWNMMARYPDLFAAAIPMSGGWGCWIYDLYLGIRIPVWNFHAANDTAVSVSYSDDAVAALRNAGGNPIYTRYRGGGHAIWRTAYNTPGLVDWVMAQTRGAASATLPLVTIRAPTAEATLVNPSASLDLAGTAAHSLSSISQVTVTNALNGLGGVATGTTVWSLNGLPLETGASNVIVVTARGITSAGITTFNDTLTVQVAQAPEIVTQPASQTLRPGIPATLCVTATGAPTPTYQWRKDGTNLHNAGRIAGATDACLTISGALESDSGVYSVVVSNTLDVVISSNATLQVTPLDHFAWSTLPSPQIDKAPFPATITAEDYLNRRVTNFNACIPLSSVTVRSNQLGNGNSLVNFPLGTYYHDERTQAIYPPQEIGAAGPITSLSLEVVTRPGQTLNAWTIRMKHTPLVAYTNALWEGGGWTTVYQTNLSVTATGWISFQLTTPFDYNGVDSLMVDFSFNNSTWTSNGFCRATPHRVNQALYHQTDSGYGDPLKWSGASPTPYRSLYTPNLRLTMDGGPAASLQPSVACFTNGTWSGGLTIQAPATNLTLQADDGLGHSGWSNPFDVLPSPPVILAQPTNSVVPIGGTATYCVIAVGTDPLYYTWLHDGTPISGATGRCYITHPVLFSDSGSHFSCLISNAYGSAITADARLVVNRPPVADASATPPVVLSGNTTDAQAILDGTRSSDPDGDLLQYLWFHTLNAQPPALLASGAVAVVVLPVGTHPLELVVSDGMLSSTNPVTIEVITASQGMQRLIAQVTSSWPAYPPLVATLRAGLASVERDDAIPAINQLLAFQNKVRAQVAPSDPTLATSLMEQAQEILDALNGGHTNPGGRPHGRFTSVAHQSNGHMQLQFAAERGPIYILEASTNLVDWEPIGLAREQDDGTFTFEDVNAARFPTRYYRVVSPCL
ncbi:MAG: immunoglobulin domain-containing protein [Verrucomicrobia bacterium]|nr:immunoglobulin domain-containing protein [Verrucomicrobiota bacterium]